MQLEKNPNGTWYCRFKKDGRWLRRSLKTTNKREAQTRLGNLDLDLVKAETIRGAARRWLMEQEQRILTDKHLRDLERTAEELGAAFGPMAVDDVKRGHLLPWLQEKPRRLRLARAFFRWCMADYNTVRPHSSIGNLTPSEYAASLREEGYPSSLTEQADACSSHELNNNR